jgi:hypothetical protein
MPVPVGRAFLTGHQAGVQGLEQKVARADDVSSLLPEIYGVKYVEELEVRQCWRTGSFESVDECLGVRCAVRLHVVMHVEIWDYIDIA